MIKIKHYIKIMVLACVTPLMAASVSHFEENTPPSLADHLHLSRSKDPVDGGWLPRLTGLPNKEQVAQLTQRVKDVMKEEKDPRCTSIDWHLRMLVFQHFAIYQHMVNEQNFYLDKNIALQWAHVLAMILQESSGDSTNITDMRGHSLSTNQPKTNLNRWKRILALTEKDNIRLNAQTNYGLTQTSADRLFTAFCLAQAQKYDTEFLEGREGASTPRKVNLNTAIAIRRLIWFYQDFAQGRVKQADERTHKRDLGKPLFYEKYMHGLNMALLYCGTRLMFKEDLKDKEKEIPAFLDAMASISYCKLGNPRGGYGTNEMSEKCFAAWVTLCPALNIDIAMLTPLSYFATRNAKPVCEGTFQRLLNSPP